MYGQRTPLPVGFSTELADLDFETYSEAGFVWLEDLQKWQSVAGKGKPGGLGVVGLQKYAEHPTTEILVMKYDLKDGRGQQTWFAGIPFPADLREHLGGGGLIAAWNSGFEERIWRLVGVRKYGWPELPPSLLRCDMAKARAHCLPGSLAKAGAALRIGEDAAKLKDGTRLIRKFCMPRSPTKKDSRLRITPCEDADGVKLHEYCGRDITAEATVSAQVPDLNPVEMMYWGVDQECNRRGVRMDKTAIDAICAMLTEVYAAADYRVQELTDGEVTSVSEVQKLLKWLGAQGVQMAALDIDAVEAILGSPVVDLYQPAALEVLTLRKSVSSAAVKKAFTMQRMLSKDDRLHDLFIYHSARTGRDAGADAQPQNLPGGGPKVKECPCGCYHVAPICPQCGVGSFAAKAAEWNISAMEQALELIYARNASALAKQFGSVVSAASGCLRGLFIADEGEEFIATDYSSIEAVVAAALAGEQWRLDTFACQEDIYLASVGKIKNRTLEEYQAYKAETGMHHPDRKIGKVAELASGFGGWVGAWRAFGAESVFTTEQELKNAILAWRAESPAIVAMWGGQFKGKPWERVAGLSGLEGAAIAAVQNEGEVFTCQGIKYQVLGHILYCTLLSGRRIAYHEPNIVPDPTRGGVTLVFSGYNTNPKMGPVGWVRLKTYGGKLFENVVQATARDILAWAAIRCEQKGYKVILRVHDELVTMRPKGEGSVAELEAICGDLPHWAKGWPVRATGGWVGNRYRKE